MKVFHSFLATTAVYATTVFAYESHPQPSAGTNSDSSQIEPSCVAPDIYPCEFPDNFIRTTREYYGIVLNPLNTKWVETEFCHYTFKISINGKEYGNNREDYSCSATVQGYESARVEWKSKFGNTTRKGTFEIKRKLRNNLLDGVSKIYDSNDNLLQTQSFKNGIRDGEEKTYSKEGALTTIRHFSNNLLNKNEIEYDEFGDKASEVVYENGQIKSSTEYKSYKGKKKLDALNCTFAQSMGMIDSQRNCYELVDMINDCYQNNKSKPYLHSTKTFKGGLKHGVEHFYYAPCGDDGPQPNTVYKENPYENGVLNGTVKEFYPNGKLKSTVTYEDGDAVTEKKCFTINGKVQKTGTEKMKCD